MFCTKCGKEVFSGDRFCGNCGCEIRQQRATTNDEIVFNPPFREEAKRKTEEMKSAFIGFKTAEKAEEPRKVKHEPVNFDWGMEKRSPRKVDNSVFDWSGVVEQRKRQRGYGLETRETRPMEPIRTEETSFAPTVPAKPQVEVIGFAQPAATLYFEREEAPMSIEELERELFGETGGIQHKENTQVTTKDLREINAQIGALDTDEMPVKPIIAESGFVPAFQQERTETPEGTKEVFDETKDIQDVLDERIELPQGEAEFIEDKFYTFHQKCSAFDELIEKEKSHLSEMGVEFPGSAVDEAKPLDITTESIEPEMEEILAKAKEEKNRKLRYSDVFPRVEVDENGNPVKNAENYSPVPDMVVKHDPVVPQIIAKNKQLKEEEKKSEPVVYSKRPEKPKNEVQKDLTGIFDRIEIDEDPPKKRHILSRIIISILVLMILCEGVILGTKFVAPNSQFSLWVNQKVVWGLNCVTDLYRRITNKEVETAVVISGDASEMQMLVLEAASNSKKIGEITYNPDILFAMVSDPAFPEVTEAGSFVDEEWFEDKNGDTKTYGQILMAAIVRYFDGWKDINKDENLLGINKLEIGETKIGDTGFYTLVRVTYATADGDELAKYQTVYTGVSDESIVINMVKEETI